ncbi:MAG: helix-turn-helix domain-containing protein [Gammaproteobacteria bacterium]|nr:helix-turn-helix domain-containing protein [Gammaproteobacteria bacterium]
MDLRKKRGRPAQQRVKNVALQRAIESVGGVKKLALELGVHSNSVSGWLYRDLKIPAHHVKTIVQATQGTVRPEELRPDIFLLEYS